MSALDSPLAVFALSFVLQWLAALAGDLLRKVVRPLRTEDRQDFDIVRAAALTLLGLLIGFTFSMAVTRYDLRKNYEEAEANAIGTEYLRADLLPTADASRVRELLRKYLGERILFYQARQEIEVGHVHEDTAKLQSALWSVVSQAIMQQPTPIQALLVSGMNDVLNAQGYTQAAWWNRIPTAGWALMFLIAVSCNFLVGYGERRYGPFGLVLPVILSVSFLLIADIDAPRGGLIRVDPQNLLATLTSVTGE